MKPTQLFGWKAQFQYTHTREAVVRLITYRSQKSGDASEPGKEQSSVPARNEPQSRVEAPVTYKVVGLEVTSFSQA